ncbi:MAG TPA: hypothetical protein VGC06_12710 [Actinomycetes bacterium]
MRVAAGQLPDPLDALLAALGDHLGGAELTAQVGAPLEPAGLPACGSTTFGISAGNAAARDGRIARS